MDGFLEKGERAEQLFSELGMNMTTAFNIFVRQAVRRGKIPFEISLNTPNAEPIAAIKEANKLSRDPNAKRYSSFEELVAEVISSSGYISPSYNRCKMDFIG